MGFMIPDATKRISSMGWSLPEGCHFAISILNVIQSVKPCVQEAYVSSVLSSALGLNFNMLERN